MKGDIHKSRVWVRVLWMLFESCTISQCSWVLMVTQRVNMRDNLLCEFLGSVMKANFVSLTNSFQLKEIKGMRRSARTSSTGVRAVGYLNQSRSIGVGREPTREYA
jgi:hypothetical protein